jgi:hypothetical protein
MQMYFIEYHNLSEHLTFMREMDIELNEEMNKEKWNGYPHSKVAQKHFKNMGKGHTDSSRMRFNHRNQNNKYARVGR